MHGSEDYPAPENRYVPTVRELKEIYRGPRWASFDAFVTRMLKVGGMLLVWSLILATIYIVVRGEV